MNGGGYRVRLLTEESHMVCILASMIDVFLDTEDYDRTVNPDDAKIIIQICEAETNRVYRSVLGNIDDWKSVQGTALEAIYKGGSDFSPFGRFQIVNE